MVADARLAVREKIKRLEATLKWAREIRLDQTKPTIALQLTDELIPALEDQIEVERIREDQLERFFGDTKEYVTELGTPH